MRYGISPAATATQLD